MIGFVMVGTNDLDKAIKFYDTILETINLNETIKTIIDKVLKQFNELFTKIYTSLHLSLWIFSI